MKRIKIIGVAEVSELTRPLRPLEANRVIAILYDIATGALTATAPLSLDESLHQRDLPDGQVLVCNTFSYLDEKMIRSRTKIAVEAYYKKKENGIL